MFIIAARLAGARVFVIGGSDRRLEVARALGAAATLNRHGGEDPHQWLAKQSGESRGAEVAYHDPFVPTVGPIRDYPELAGMHSVPWDEAGLSSYSAALILTDHDGVDYRTLLREVPLVVDTRNVTAALDPPPGKVLKA